jgi:hypothetical protein
MFFHQVTCSLAIFALSLPLLVRGEEIAYVIAAATAKPSDRPIAAGSKQYALKDVRIKEVRNRDGSIFWDKSVELASGFSLGIDVSREPTHDGVGLVISNPHYPIGISWNWFQAETDDTYKQVKGDSHIKVQLKQMAAAQEIVAVEFLDDTTLTFTDDMFRHKPGEDSHRLVVKKGSVLRVAP